MSLDTKPAVKQKWCIFEDRGPWIELLRPDGCNMMCRRCGIFFNPEFPCGLSDLVEAMERFILKHNLCNEEEVNP